MAKKRSESSRADLALNYAATGMQAVVPLIAIPILARHLNADVMALILLFTTFAILLAVLDAGLSATSMRQVADHRGGGIDAQTALGRVRSIELTYGILAIALLAIMMFLSGFLAREWFVSTIIPSEVLAWYLRVVFVGLAARFLGGLYRNTLIGLDLVRWVSWYSIAFTILRYGVACAIAVIVPDSGTYVLLVIAGTYLLETLGVAVKSRIELRRLANGQRPKASFVHLREILPFSLSIFSSFAIWAVISQTDRIVLSGQMSLAAYGEYAVLVMLAAGISLLGTPVAAVVQPRLTRYIAAGDEASAANLFRRTSSLVSALVFGATVWLFLVGSEVVTIYFGDEPTLTAAGQILALYAIGNAAVALSAFSYYLQYALGTLKLHLKIGLVQFAISVPLTIYAAIVFGPLGCSIVWAVTNCLVLIIWVPYVLHRFRPTWLRPWIRGTSVPPVLGVIFGAVALLLTSRLFPESSVWQVIEVLFVGLACLVGATLPFWIPMALTRFSGRHSQAERVGSTLE